ncbi:hypothetical protein [Catenuloplanes atrovinosus]|uniref:TctA family transporter n=1 Tax=Catenuloplanes atrovinosus TaxID=137266 RepID=A0AAE3YJM9_9ACTN|nr:hypothetical protein [Catenuloplanes atrovinosus]MDR7274715.1 TctA family transporter [Catenuloplanes atrovinosus]
MSLAACRGRAPIAPPADLLTGALPGIGADAGIRLLLRLTGWHADLPPAHITALIRTVQDNGLR